ncbi:MAG: hypothetical protein NZ551_02415 [Microscillaceae bacterium]|nr:hypothetical protein [Microscillaceae bacterium]MDW8460039.1 hypothetical protein [Cytophagales bacterium]
MAILYDTSVLIDIVRLAKIENRYLGRGLTLIWKAYNKKALEEFTINQSDEQFLRKTTTSHDIGLAKVG